MQACWKLLPYAGGVLMLIMLMFAIYVRNVPPKQKVELQPKDIKVKKDDSYMKGFQEDIIQKTQNILRQEKMEKQKAQAEPPTEPEEPVKPAFVEPDTIEL
jgi:hypothetical protein